MSVVIETTLGDITVDLFLKERPRASMNFLKLCKMKYYNYSLFHTVSRGFIAQTGDPTGSRNGGESIFGLMDGPLKRFFVAETNPRIRHTIMGLVSFVGNEENMIGSQFFFTLGDELTYLDGKHCIFGQVTEGLDVLELINEAICDSDQRPYQDIRITHTVILEDPLPDPEQMNIPSRSPSPSAERLQGGRIAPDEEIDETANKSIDEINEIIAEREAKARATILEMVGDLPDAEMAPPENVLFVCKLNPVTTDDDLEIIFSRFGKIKSCEVIRDHKTGDSLQYAFVEFLEQKSCEDAYFKMDNVLIDDRRIHVDFSQSVSKVKWMGKGKGVRHFDDKDDKIKRRGKKGYERSQSPNEKQNFTYHSSDPKLNKTDKDKRNNRGSVHKRGYKNDSQEINHKHNSMRKQSRSISPLSRSRSNIKNGPRRHDFNYTKAYSTERIEEKIKNSRDVRRKRSRSVSNSSDTEKCHNLKSGTHSKFRPKNKEKVRDSSSSVSPHRKKNRRGDSVSSSSSSSETPVKHGRRETREESRNSTSSSESSKKGRHRRTGAKKIHKKSPDRSESPKNHKRNRRYKKLKSSTSESSSEDERSTQSKRKFEKKRSNSKKNKSRSKILSSPDSPVVNKTKAKKYRTRSSSPKRKK